jgi:hypothetical protein
VPRRVAVISDSRLAASACHRRPAAGSHGDGCDDGDEGEAEDPGHPPPALKHVSDNAEEAVAATAVMKTAMRVSG